MGALPIEAPVAFDWRAWLLAARPRTLAVALGPIAVGTAVASGDGGARLMPALAALVGAVLLQLGSNFANDVYDFEKGADTDARVGPARATQLGLLTPEQMKRGMWAVFAAATIVGSYLVAVAGWPIVWIGLASILAAIAYTGGPWPFGYHGLGDAQDSVVIDSTLFQEYGFDVQDLVEAVLDGNGVPDSCLNVAVGDLAGGLVSHWLASREATSWYRPMLMITYQEP